MAQPLPDRAIAAIPALAGARIVDLLSDGPTNTSYRVEQGGAEYVLRVDKPGAGKIGLDRRGEEEALRAAAAAGLAPAPLHFDPAAGVFLRPFLAGRSWTVDDLAAPGNRRRLARLLRTLHGLPPAGRPFDPLAAARGYAERIGGAHARSLLRECEGLACEARNGPAAAALCHNDLVCGNMLEAGRLLLIDWEYAGIGDPYFDLAVVVQHHGLGEAAAEHFLSAYLERPPGPDERRQLELQCRFYLALLKLWNQQLPTL